jgi:hypothetical protein
MVAAATTALVACGGGETTDATTTTSSSTSSGAGGDVSAASSSTTGVGGGNGQICPANTLCLQVKQVDTGGAVASGRLGIAWYPFDDANKTPPLIAYDVPFDPATVRFDIPYQALAPVTDALLLCTRSCMDPATCPCMGDPALGFALVGVGQDTNKDGKLDAAELEATLYGVGRLGIVFSQKAYHPSPATVVDILPEGVNVGTHAYRIIPKSVKSPFDQLGIAFDGTVFDLAVCSGAPGCLVPTPNLH